MPTPLPFEELWRVATAAAAARNGLCYHPCCDVWTTRSAKLKRDSHKQKLLWQNLMSMLDKSVADKKKALEAKMVEERWRLHVVLNESCRLRTKKSAATGGAFCLVDNGLVERDLSSSFDNEDMTELKRTEL